jgi:hypothetical protein
MTPRTRGVAQIERPRKQKAIQKTRQKDERHTNGQYKRRDKKMKDTQTGNTKDETTR